MPLSLSLAKPGDAPKKLSLNLTKNQHFKVRLSWDCKSDLDLHALHAVAHGQGRATISALDDILSTYNVQRIINNRSQGHLVPNADRTFSIHGGALVHSPDAQDGALDDGDDEWLTVYPDKLNAPAGGAIEIPLIAMVHSPQGKTFKDVLNPRVIVENAQGEVLLETVLSDAHGGFKGIQMGSIIIEDGNASFSNVGTGFNGDFNSVIEHFG